jgi:hypothetical protein
MSRELSGDRATRRRNPLLNRAKNISISVVLAAGLAMLTSLTPAPSHRGRSPLQSATPLVTTNPPLFPAFDQNVTDYVVRAAPGAATQVTITAPAGTQVSVDGQPFQSGTFTNSVTINAGQSFTIAAQQAGVAGANYYYARCLPPDFPAYTIEHPGPTQAEWYVIVPDTFYYGRSDYVSVFDTNGVPLWWYNDPAAPLFGTYLTNGNLAWTNYGDEAVVRGFDGALLHTIAPVSSIGGYLDIHELILLPNGNYVFIVDLPRGPVNLSAYGGSSTATVTDCVIEEVAPSGKLVWSWSTMDHISAAQTDRQWWDPYITNSAPADPYHMNSVESDGTGSGYLVSYRHLDAIIYIDKATGNILWKLGGTPTAQSLKFVGDTYENFGGQHDARITRISCAVPDGPGLPMRAHELTVTLHDDGTNQGRAPRAVRYQVDEIGKTARLLETVTDPEVPNSGCCGSARALPGGDWVMSWGDTNNIAEYNAQQQRVFRLQLPGNYLSYRAVPVLPGRLSREALRGGMDAQFPR